MSRFLQFSGMFILHYAIAMSALDHADAKGTAFTVLYAFQGGTDGSNPHSTLIEDLEGNLYGTTYSGGANGSGTVFSVAQSGVESILYSFCAQTNCPDGAYPTAGVIADNEGNLYGTTSQGGAGCDPTGCGTVFKVTAGGTEFVLHAFNGCSIDGSTADGAIPFAGLFADRQGNLYGTTVAGGGNCSDTTNYGTVYEVAPDGAEYFGSFDGIDGAAPYGAIREVTPGAFYGVTSGGTFQKCSYGCVYTDLPTQNPGVVYPFCSQPNCSDGANPYAGLVADSANNLYGTTEYGGGRCGCGVVFKIVPNDMVETVLYTFTGGKDGAYPASDLIMDKAGNLYGTTTSGGGNHCDGHGCGTIFKLSSSGSFETLHSFKGSDGAAPYAGLLADKSGNLYGTTAQGGGTGCGGAGCGTVFALKKK